MPKFQTRSLTLMALLIALEVVLSRFLSISTQSVKIGFSFVPVLLAAVLLGPLEAGLVGALGDFVGALLFPIGAYFPGFTLTAFCMGLVFGLFLHGRQDLGRCLAAVGINQFVLGLIVNSFWISLLYGAPYLPLLATRVIQSAVLTAVQLLCIPLILRALGRIRGKVSV